LVPADAFYEWKALPDGKQPYAIARTDGAPLAFAGLWEAWRSPDDEILRTFTILTTAANGDMAQLHNRMPVILEEEDWRAWLGEVPRDPVELLRPAAADSDEGGHPFQSDRGHHSNLMAARVMASLGRVFHFMVG